METTKKVNRPAAKNHEEAQARQAFFSLL